MTDDTQAASTGEGSAEASSEAGSAISPETVLESLSQQASDVAMFPGSMRETWFFAYDVLLDQSTISRFVKKMNVGKIVSLPHYRLVWPYYHPPQNTALPTLERTNRDSDAVWGLIYDASDRDFQELERSLRVPNRYHRSAVQVVDRGGRRFPAFTFVLTLKDDVPGKPSAAYRDQLVAAAMDRSLPDEWLSQLRAMEVAG